MNVLSSCCWWRHGLWWQLLDLPDQEALLVNKLLVLGAVLQKRRQKSKQLFTVADENFLYSHRLIGVRNEDLQMSVWTYIRVGFARTLKT